MSRKIIKILSIFMLIVSVFTFISCDETKEQKKADKMLKKYHEKELLPMLENYYKTIMTIPPEDIFSLSENGTYVLSEKTMAKIGPIIEDIKSIHCTYHSNEEIPRNTEAWNSWMACYSSTLNGESITSHIENNVNIYKEKLKNNYHVTYCPYCLAIEKSKAEKTADYLPDFTETYLLEFKNLRKLLFEGLKIITDEEELKNNMNQGLYSIINNGQLLSFQETDNTYASYKGDSGDTYYLNLTAEYKDELSTIYKFHNEHHRQISERDWSNIWMYEKRDFEKRRNDRWWLTDDDAYNSSFVAEINEGNISSCPFCILIDDQKLCKEGIHTDGLYYSDMYTYSILAKNKLVKFAESIESIKTSINIESVGNALKLNKLIGIGTWNNKTGTFYGKIRDISEADSYYDGNNLQESPVYIIRVWSDSSWLSSDTVDLKILQSSTTYSVIDNYQKGDEIYFNGTINIDSLGQIEIKNVGLVNPNLVKEVQLKRQANKDALIRALADIYVGGATPLTASDFED